jgi:hypothetical protein
MPAVLRSCCEGSLRWCKWMACASGARGHGGCLCASCCSPTLAAGISISYTTSGPSYCATGTRAHRRQRQVSLECKSSNHQILVLGELHGIGSNGIFASNNDLLPLVHRFSSLPPCSVISPQGSQPFCAFVPRGVLKRGDMPPLGDQHTGPDVPRRPIAHEGSLDMEQRPKQPPPPRTYELEGLSLSRW